MTISTRDTEHEHYDDMCTRIDVRFSRIKEALFTTGIDNLWEIYLDSFETPEERQYHNCHACRQFIERFGGLVTIAEDGTTIPAIWNEADASAHTLYQPAFSALARAVRRAKVTGVFMSSGSTWGTPITHKGGIWSHFAVHPSKHHMFKRTTQTAEQAMAEKREDFKTVMHALGEFTQQHVETALTLLKTDALYRSEKVLGQAQWLHDLHVARASAHGAGRANVVWRAVATAPAGFCHPRSSMIGTLLEDIAAGMDFDTVSRRFADKMHPLAYQRPKAAPTAGAIAAAEKVMAQLGAAGSLARRFARLDDIQAHALWRPMPKHEDASQAGGVFGHLKPKAKGSESSPAMCIPAQTMTWIKFRDTVLPTAERIELKAPSCGPYSALVTAVNAEAPPIVQWDMPEARNPVSWYFWNGGATAQQFGLRGGQFYDVSAVTLKPSMWNGGNEHQGAGVLFVIADARETRSNGAALFPEILKAEFHGIRSVIEAYSRGAQIEGMDEPHVAGVMLDKSDSWLATVRVWTAGRSLEYRLDRWD